MRRFHKILIANRAEIAVRVIRTAKELGIKTVAVYAADDADSLHVSEADEAFLLPGSQLSETYLNQDKLLQIARETGAEAIHPGYGFLSENASFAERVEKAGLSFVGATPYQIRLMGEKTQAIEFVKKLEVSVIPGLQGTVDEILTQRNKLEFPVLVKASGGGGGKGMEVVHKPEQLALVLEQAQRQAQQYFGNDELFVEKYLPQARHIEVQLLGDSKGKAIHLLERECSIQRRYQKLIEEAPATSISSETRQKLFEAALKIAQAINYRGAGTIEFLVDDQGGFYFLEMNTRIQVEHPVTESITGVDLVEWQLRIAAGEELTFEQSDISANGHAIELRVCAEDPSNNFRPISGTLGGLCIPEDVRWDSFLQAGNHLSPNYDSLLGKLIIHANSRQLTIEKASRALDQLYLGGIMTNQEFLNQILRSSDFKENKIHTRWAENNLSALDNSSVGDDSQLPAVELLAAFLLYHFYRPETGVDVWRRTGYWRLLQLFNIKINGENYRVKVVKKANELRIIWNETAYKLNHYQIIGPKICFRINDKDIAIFISEEEGCTLVHYRNRKYRLQSNQVLNQVQLNKSGALSSEVKIDKVVADLFGKVIDIFVKPGDQLHKGQNMLVIESMKSEFTIQSPSDAVVKNIHVAKGNLVQDRELLVDLES
ncbi:acetyl/propionyl/methylcrotonyl-CoA carboxylase subunit alpha [Sunxiuqinia indica]|uniref:acetyl/propionyl/methylcrotonyl-CoA carboxylase subunit alpha n=1 Tax=Sunxiuqinia indica TaxID=2692584 RepID=UPI00135C1691|nr:biotin carboxylase N-terminal domain-containing protein [Sunxiuqinia indica]